MDSQPARDVENHAHHRSKPLQIAVAGKGGAGKTTVCAALMQCLSMREVRVLAVDADPTALLGSYLGVPHQGTAGQAVEEARRAVRGGLVARPRDMVGDEIRRSLVHTRYGDLLTMGALGGRGCYCAANSALRTTVKDIVEGDPSSADGRGGTGYDVLLVDCEPGLDIFSRGTLDEVDVLLVVAEPTSAGLMVAAQIWQAARELGLRAARREKDTHPVLLNKVELPSGSLHDADTPMYVSPQVQRLLAQYRLRAEWVVPYDHCIAVAIEREPAPLITYASGEFVHSVDSVLDQVMRLMGTSDVPLAMDLV